MKFLTAALALYFSASARSAPDSPAAIVVVGGLSPAGVVEAARAQLPALWRLESLRVEAGPPAASPTPDIERVGQAYLEADFLNCLAQLDGVSLNFDHLLERGRRADAARVGTYAAACALGARDEGRARELVRRLLVRELDDPNVLRRTTPEFQRLAEEERQKALLWGRVTLAVRTEPDGASIQVDGAVRCLASPCRLNLLRGEHVLVAEKMGRTTRAVPVLLEEDQTLRFGLELASPDEARRQLTTTLGKGEDPSSVEMARTASAAFGVGLVVLAWQRSGQVHANVYDRSGDSLTHVALNAEPEAAAHVVAAALNESRMGNARRGWWRQALFWSTVFGVALASAAIMFLLSKPRARRRGHDIVFR
ncbi:MAG TPA: PEGA domain-containing protein [Polyangia bacterium]|nr:PEGA domain-containing protein [Polyangia bacterium]